MQMLCGGQWWWQGIASNSPRYCTCQPRFLFILQWQPRRGRKRRRWHHLLPTNLDHFYLSSTLPSEWAPPTYHPSLIAMRSSIIGSLFISFFMERKCSLDCILRWYYRYMMLRCTWFENKRPMRIIILYITIFRLSFRASSALWATDLFPTCSEDVCILYWFIHYT